jgi:hypothetical protein
LKSIKGLLTKKACQREAQFLRELIGIWKDEGESQKFFRAHGEELSKLEESMKNLKQNQSENVSKVMMKMSGESDTALKGFVFQAFVGFHKEYQKNKELEDEVKATETKLRSFMKEKNEGARSVLSGIHGASNTGVMHEHFEAWTTMVKEAKQEAEMAEILARGGNKVNNFSERNTKNAHNTMERARQHQEGVLLMSIFVAWRLDSRMESLLRKHTTGIEGKRGQLQRVQGMFRDFAVKLEQGIKSGGDSERDLAEQRKGRGKKLVKNEGTVSLPEIGQKSAPPPVPAKHR